MTERLRDRNGGKPTPIQERYGKLLRQHKRRTRIHTIGCLLILAVLVVGAVWLVGKLI